MFLASSSFYPEAASEDPIQPNTKAYAKLKTGVKGIILQKEKYHKGISGSFLSVTGCK